jgi:hypothetical protein
MCNAVGVNEPVMVDCAGCCGAEMRSDQSYYFEKGGKPYCALCAAPRLAAMERRDAARAKAKSESDKCIETGLLTDVLRAFAHPDLCEVLGGNVEGNASIVFQRNKAILTLGDFRRARSLFLTLQDSLTVDEKDKDDGPEQGA